MAKIHHTPSNPESASVSARLDTSLGGHGGALPRAFYSDPSLAPPLAETGPGYGAALQPSRDQVLRAWVATTLFWACEIIAGACLFILLFFGLFMGEIYR